MNLFLLNSATDTLETLVAISIEHSGIDISSIQSRSKSMTDLAHNVLPFMNLRLILSWTQLAAGRRRKTCRLGHSENSCPSTSGDIPPAPSRTSNSALSSLNIRQPLRLPVNAGARLSKKSSTLCGMGLHHHFSEILQSDKVEY